MLSDLLNSFAQHYAGWAQGGGVQMDARVCALMHTSMTEAADQARRLEAAQVPGAQQPLPSGVVRLDDFRLAHTDGRPAA